MHCNLRLDPIPYLTGKRLTNEFGAVTTTNESWTVVVVR